MSASESYSPSSQVKWLHERQRFSLSFGSAPGEFPSSFDGDDSQDWAMGCVMWLVIFGIIGLAMALFLAFGYLISCCCCKAAKKDKAAAEMNSAEPEAYNKRLYKVTLVVCIVFFIFALATFAPVKSFDNGFNGGLDGIESAQQTLRDLTSVANSIVDNLGGAAEETRDLKDQSTNPSVQSELEEFAGEIEQQQDTARDAIDTADDLIDSINPVVSDGRQASDDYATVIAFIYVALMCLTMIVLLLTLIPKRFCSCPYKGVGVPMNLVFLVLLWLITGVFLAIGMMSADYCMTPNENTIQLIGGDSVRYYLRCVPGEEEKIDSDDGLRYDVRRTVTETQDLIRNTYGDTIKSIEDQGAEGHIVDGLRGLNETYFKGILDDLDDLDDLASCSSIRRTWDTFINAFCGDFISDGIIVLFGLQTVMGIMLFLILILGWSFCIRHPGRSKPTAEADGTQNGKGSHDAINPIGNGKVA